MEDRMAALEADVRDALDEHGVGDGAYTIERHEWSIMVDASAEKMVGRALFKSFTDSDVSVRQQRRDAPQSDNFTVTHRSFNERQREILEAAKFLLDSDETPYQDLWQVLDGESHYDPQSQADIGRAISQSDDMDVFDMVDALTEADE